MRDYLYYLSLRFRRTVQEFKKRFSGKREIIKDVSALILGMIITRKWLGKTVFDEQFKSWLAWSFFAGVVVRSVELGIDFFRTSYLLHAENQKEIAELNASITKLEKGQSSEDKRRVIKEQLEKILEYGYNVALIDRDTVYESEVDQYNRWHARAEGFVRTHRNDSDVKRFQQGGLPVLEEFLKDYLD